MKHLAGAAWLASAVLLTVPAIVFRFAGFHSSATVEALIFGFGILGAAFLLSWAAEIAQLEVSQAFALAVLALIAILPEYAIDLYFAWRAADDPIYANYAAANMTGANRLLVGFGWPVIVWLFWLRWRRPAVHLGPHDHIAARYLGIAPLYAFVIAARGSFMWIDTVLLVPLFALYLYQTGRLESEEPELVGPALLLSRLRRRSRLLVNLLLFVFSGCVIFLSAEPFAESLIDSGHELGIDEFLLVQWIAPLASEAPEFIIACLWTLRRHASMAISALISSTVNQWTLLIGTISVVYSINAGSIQPLRMDLQQRQEIFLTAALSIFAVVAISDRRLTWWQTLFLFVPFATQLAVPDLRWPMAWVYLGLAAGWGFFDRRHLVALFRRSEPPRS
ncbi:MAG: sodium:calcium antiporter [Gemmatimonadota bacterium]